MSQEQVMRLCGGTFFALITRALNNRYSSTEPRLDGRPQPPLTERACLQELIYVFYPEFPATSSSFKNYVTDYKRCLPINSVNLPMDNTEALKRFHREILSDYLTPLRRMRDFCNRYVENLKADELIRRLLELMDADPSIRDHDIFYTDMSGKPVSFLEMRYSKTFYLPAFMLGIWHFILIYRMDNTIGRSTYEQFYRPGPKNRSDEWCCDIGNGPQFADVIYQKPSTQILLRYGLTNAPKDRLSDVDNNLCGDYSLYLARIKRAYQKVKTMLYTIPRDFYSFYVPNHIQAESEVMQNGSSRPLRGASACRQITDVTAATLSASTNYIILTGPGGIGKSMMMRHLLLDAIETYPQNRMVPVFVSLKDFKSDCKNLFDFIYPIVHELQPSVTEADFNNDLDTGHIILLFDGLDEIRSNLREEFENLLDHFTNIYPHNIFIISTRPYSDFIHMTRYTVAEVLPFDKAQALELVDKLEYRPDEPAFKANFKKAIETELMETHADFVTNPLLLTIMLLTYDLYADIPSKRYLFYRKAYDALAQQHDATKPGVFHRIWETGWTPERFAEVFSEFCAYTYIKEQYDFTPDEMQRYFYNLEEMQRFPKDQHITVTNFTDDLVNNLCLMYPESGLYHFTHRSFQEYFCALFFSNLRDADLKAVGDYFERRNVNNDSDAAFAMLYDMIPLKVEEYIFLPTLQNLFTKQDESEDYDQYLLLCYPELRYVDGLGYDEVLSPMSYLIRFICNLLGMETLHLNLELPPYPEFKYEDFYYIDNSDEDILYPDDGVKSESYLMDNDLEIHPEDHCGTSYHVRTADLLRDTNTYMKIIAALWGKKSELYREFRAVYGYYRELKQRYSGPRGADPCHFFSR